MGGNLLLDVGAKEDGTILPEQENVLRELGNFTRANEAAIWGTKPLTSDIFGGGKTVSENGKAVYLFQYGEAVEPVPVFIDERNVESVSLLSDNSDLEFIRDKGQIWVKLPENAYIHGTAVFKVTLKEATK